MATSSTRPNTKSRSAKRDSAATTAEVQIPYEEVSRRAYEKFVARGSVDGFHEQDWFDAEDELRAEFRDRQ